MSISLNTKQMGDGNITILFLHGLYASATNWSGITRYLKDDFRCISLDLRNHGESPHTAFMTYFDMASDVIELIQQLALDNCVLVGHSMGGKTAMTVALQCPHLVSHLIVEDIAPVAYEHGHYEMNQALRQIDLTTLASRQDADQQLAPCVEDPRVRQFLLTNLLGKPGEWRWRIGLDQIADNLHHILSMPLFAPNTQYDGPTLIAYGEQSDYYQPKYEHTTRQLFPHLSVEPYANTQHWVHALHPKKFSAMVDDFIYQNT